MVKQFIEVEKAEVSPIENLSKIISDNVRLRKLITVADLCQKTAGGRTKSCRNNMTN